MQSQARVDDILAQYGCRASHPVAAALELAVSVQRHCFDAGSSDRTEVTRSTALWSLLSTDAGVASVLGAAGLDLREFGDLLGVSAEPPPAESDVTPDTYIDAQFAHALSNYLESGSPGGILEPSDLALVILLSSQDSREGLLPSRLERLGSTMKQESQLSGECPAVPGRTAPGQHRTILSQQVFAVCEAVSARAA